MSADDASKEDFAKFDEKFIIKLTNEKIVDRNARQCCKVLQISSQLNIDDLISALLPSDYPNLFIFIIKCQNLIFNKKLQKDLLKFDPTRPLIIVLTFEDGNDPKYYHKSTNSSEFKIIDQNYSGDFGMKLEAFEDKIFRKLSCTKDQSTIYRFLRTLNFQEAHFGTMLMEVAKRGSKADLLALLDASFEDDGRMLSNQVQNYISEVFVGDESDDEEDKSESDAESDSKQSSDEDQGKDKASEQPKKQDTNPSLFLTAVQHSNKEVIDYLITYWTPLIQQLPFEHQVKISTAAFDTKQFDVLCDLLELSDYPFPDEFTFTKSKVDKKLKVITEQRMDFKSAIEREEFNKIDDFINQNLDSKFIYSIDNNTALIEAGKARQYGVFYYLKSLGFEGENCKDILDSLKPEERSAAVEKATEQRRSNIEKSLKDFHKSVWHLSARSSIHNRRISKDKETEYREKIRSWLKDIHRIAPEMTEVAASCEDLKIIFDFESHSVENASFSNPTALGMTYSGSKWIFIGAKFTSKNQEQEIKGVLAHELCHYVMCLIYDNQFNPYYKNDKQAEAIFKEIVEIIDKWSTAESTGPDDKCNGIISNVYSYSREKFGLELIVRVVHILAQFDNNPETSKNIQVKYQNLFNFWFHQVVPEMQSYFKRDEKAIRVNRTAGLLSSLSNSKIEFSAPKDIEPLIKSKVTIVTTNVPKLFLINIHKNLQEKCASLLNSQNLFLESEKISNNQVLRDMQDLNVRGVKLNVFVDCSRGCLNNLNSIIDIENFTFILIASNVQQSSELEEICNKNKIKPSNAELNFIWNDLAEESQIKLLQTKITFQDNSQSSLMELLSKNTCPDQNEVNTIIRDFATTLNQQLFNLLVEQQTIVVNSNVGDNLSNKNFNILFQSRNFIKKGFRFKIPQEELLSNVENQQYVLISDTAGSGKSWVVKNICKLIRKQDPTRWVTYVDLKQDIKEFRSQKLKSDFAAFFIGHILKPKADFEAKIFKKLYKIGKVSIIFDGFDEIAPDCAEFVADLSKSFEFNEGNQLWIATRDFFEVNLQQKLGIEDVYKLAEFKEDEGVNFIVSSWILLDTKDQKISNFNKFMQDSPNLSNYQEKAKKIVQKVTMSKRQAFGLPLLFGMIVDGILDDLPCNGDLNSSVIFIQFVDAMFLRWAYHKGILRIEGNKKSQHYELRFMGFHHYCAIESLFPELLDIFFPDYDKSEWPVAEVVAGGIMTIIGSTYSFCHEAFREFFIADFLHKVIRKPKVKPEIVDLLIKVVTVHKFGIIRMFLNDFIDDYSIIEKCQPELEKSVEKFENMENMSEFFTENQDNLARLVIEVLKRGKYEKVRDIVCSSISEIATKTKELSNFANFFTFAFSTLWIVDIKFVLHTQNILQKIIEADQDFAIFDCFLSKLDEKFGQEFTKQELKSMSSEPEVGNIFYYLAKLEDFSEEKVKKFIEILQKYLDDCEVMELMDKCDKIGESILKILVQDDSKFQKFCNGAECVFKNQNFKIIAAKTDSAGENILHWSANVNSKNFHEQLWKLILKSFNNYADLKDFVNQKNKSQNNFLHILLLNNNSDVFEFTLTKLMEILNEPDYHEILRSTGLYGRNLLQFAALESNEIKTNQILWSEFRDSCKSDEEFLDILKEIDTEGDNIVNLAAASTAEIFQFIHEKLEKITSNEEIRKLWLKLGDLRRTVLQSAAQQTDSLELHEVIWEFLQKYFNSFEVLVYVKNRDIYGNNVILDVIDRDTQESKEFSPFELKNTKEIKELTWINVEKIICSENIENIQKCEEILNIEFKSFGDLTEEQKSYLKLDWIDSTNSVKLFDDVIKLIEQNVMTIKSFTDLQLFMADENIENHKILWKHLEEQNKQTYEEFRKIFYGKLDYEGNYISQIVQHNTADVIEFTLNKLKENLTESDYHKMLKSKGYLVDNLLTIAARHTNDDKIHQILLNEMKNSCKTNSEFRKMLGEVDDCRSYLYYRPDAKFEDGEISEFEKITKVMQELGFQSSIPASSHNNPLESQKKVSNYLNPSEVTEVTNYSDNLAENLHISPLYKSPEELIQDARNGIDAKLNDLALEFEQCQDFIGMCKDMMQSFFGSNMLDFNIDSSIDEADLTVENVEDLHAFKSDKNIENHKNLWSNLLHDYKNRENLKQLFLTKDIEGYNFIHVLIICNTADVIEFTLKKLKENLSESDFQEILRSKGKLDRNLLQYATHCTQDIKIHQILWNELQDSFESAEFIEILSEVDEHGRNVVQLAAAFATDEIFKLIYEKLEKNASKDKIRKLLTKTENANRNLLQVACRQNMSLDLHKMIWKILQNYFNSTEILEFIKNCDNYQDNLLTVAIEHNTKEVADLTFQKVTKVLNSFNLITKDNENIIKNCEKIIKNISISNQLQKDEKEIFKLNWIKDESSEVMKLTDDVLERLNEQHLENRKIKDFHFLAANENLMKFENLWEKFEVFNEDLKQMMLAKDENGNSYIHHLATEGTIDKIEFTFKMLKESLNESDCKEILTSKGYLGRNVLQVAAVTAKDAEIHQILWTELQFTCKSDDEFLEMIQDTDIQNNNVLGLAALFSTAEIFKLIQEKLEKIAKPEKIRKLLVNLGFARGSLLQAAAAQNRSSELHEALWEIIQKYFDSAEILQFIKHRDNYGRNMLITVMCGNTQEVKELTWNKVKNIVISLGLEDNENFRKFEEITGNVKEFWDLTEEQKATLKLDWIDTANSTKLFNDIAELMSAESLNDLQPFIGDEIIKNHEILWKNLEQNPENLKQLMTEKDVYGNNFMSLLVAYNTADVVEFTLNKIKENFDEFENHEILTSKGYLGRNLLQIAAVNSKVVKIHQTLWTEIQNSCNSYDKFLKILEQVDNNGSNVFHLAASFTSSEIFELLISKLEKLADNQTIKTILSSMDRENTNLLNMSAIRNKNLKLHKSIWIIICKYFDDNEILKFIKHCDNDGDNLVCNLVIWNTKEIIEFKWNQIKSFINTKEAQVEYLMHKGHRSNNLHQLALENRNDGPQVEAWVLQIMKEYKINF